MINKKLLVRIALALGTVVLLVGGVLLVMDILSWKKVTITLSFATKSVIIYHTNSDEDYNSDTYKVTTVDSSSTVKLKTGSYIAKPSGDNISSSLLPFTVTGDTSVPITPYYSEEYLSKAFQGELTGISAALSSKYPEIAQDYTIETGRFYHFGDWYAATLYAANPEPGAGVDIYGVILHNVDGQWIVASKPGIVFTYTDNSSIPKDIISLVNQQVNNY